MTRKLQICNMIIDERRYMKNEFSAQNVKWKQKGKRNQ